MSTNFSGQVKRLEEKVVGGHRERCILVITCADRGDLCRENEPLLDNEIAPGLMAFCYNGRLTKSEIEELKAEYAAKTQIGRASCRERV